MVDVASYYRYKEHFEYLYYIVVPWEDKKNRQVKEVDASKTGGKKKENKKTINHMEKVNQKCNEEWIHYKRLVKTKLYYGLSFTMVPQEECLV